MLPPHQQPLEIAATVLTASTLEGVRRSPSFNLQGWRILDRWAYNSPTELKQLEAQGEMILLERILRQQGIEHEALNTAAGQGMSEHEILQMLEIPMNL